MLGFLFSSISMTFEPYLSGEVLCMLRRWFCMSSILSWGSSCLLIIFLNSE